MAEAVFPSAGRVPLVSTPQPAPFSDFFDIDAFLRVPRLAGVAAGPAGSAGHVEPAGSAGRVVAAIEECDEHGSQLVSALWQLDITGEEPARRLTFSTKGESSPLFAPDGSVLFTSARPGLQGEEDEEEITAIWRLPTSGEASIVTSTPGGLGLIAVADDGTILASTSVLPGSSLDEDSDRRKVRKEAKQTTIWHTGMPMRFWDRELNETSPRLVLIDPEGEPADLSPAVDTLALHNASADLSPDGRAVVTTWTERTGGGETRSSLVLIDTTTHERTVLLPAGDDHEYSGPKFSHDGERIAIVRRSVSTPSDTSYAFLEIHSLDGNAPVVVDVGDLTVSEYAWAADGTLLVAGDLHSSGAILTVDGRTGQVRTLASDGVYASIDPCPDGSVLALRSDIAKPPRAVRITSEGEVHEVAAPGAVGDLPGSVEWVSTETDGVTVGGWLCVPEHASVENPAPVMLWIHGGPHGSYNAWSWRWCPWLAVARGYAVLMPDPAMSTGYGHAGLNRGWPRRPDVVYEECEALFDDVLARAELDATRTAMLGASFGGFMANWIATHTDRFDAIVTHAGLWALDQQHRTTDAAAGKMRVHGHEADNVDWYRAYSPHHAATQITTPVLITHGNRDFRVPVSEALRMWWDLVSGWEGPPETMPHRFLQLTSENHWVLTPSNSRVWNETVLAFCDEHVRGGEPIPEVLPW